MTWEEQLRSLYDAIEQAEESKAKSAGVRRYFVAPAHRLRVDHLEIEICPADNGGYQILVYSGRKVGPDKLTLTRAF